MASLGGSTLLKLLTLKIVANDEMIGANAGLLFIAKWLWWRLTFDLESIGKGVLQPIVHEL